MKEIDRYTQYKLVDADGNTFSMTHQDDEETESVAPSVPALMNMVAEVLDYGSVAPLAREFESGGALEGYELRREEVVVYEATDEERRLMFEVIEHG